MKPENLDYLKRCISSLGFQDVVNAMEESICNGITRFLLIHKTEFNGEKMQFDLNLSKNLIDDTYVFDKFDATLFKSPASKVSQPFYLNDTLVFSAEECYNLLSGRSVCQTYQNAEGNIQHDWHALDLRKLTREGHFGYKSFYDHRDYDLGKVLEKHPIAELKSEEQKNLLVQSLNKGNLQPVNFDKDGLVQMRFIAADP